MDIRLTTTSTSVKLPLVFTRTPSETTSDFWPAARRKAAASVEAQPFARHFQQVLARLPRRRLQIIAGPSVDVTDVAPRH